MSHWFDFFTVILKSNNNNSQTIKNSVWNQFSICSNSPKWLGIFKLFCKGIKIKSQSSQFLHKVGAFKSSVYCKMDCIFGKVSQAFGLKLCKMRWDCNSRMKYLSIVQFLTCWNMLEGPAISSIELVAEVGTPSVVAWPSAAVLAGALITLTTHGLWIAMCWLVPTWHPLPLP